MSHGIEKINTGISTAVVYMRDDFIISGFKKSGIITGFVRKA